MTPHEAVVNYLMDLIADGPSAEVDDTVKLKDGDTVLYTNSTAAAFRVDSYEEDTDETTTLLITVEKKSWV